MSAIRSSPSSRRFPRCGGSPPASSGCSASCRACRICRFCCFALLLGGAGWWIQRATRAGTAAQGRAGGRSPPSPKRSTSASSSWSSRLEVEVGYRLVGLVSKDASGGLLRRLRAVRKQVSREFGFLVPVVHVRDNPDLRSTGYRIMVYGVERAAGEVHPDKLLAIPADKTLGEIHGIPTRDPVFGRPAQWIMPAMAEQARAAGYTVFDAAVVIATHFERVIKDNIESLFGRAELDGVLAFLGKQLAEAGRGADAEAPAPDRRPQGAVRPARRACADPRSPNHRRDADRGGRDTRNPRRCSRRSASSCAASSSRTSSARWTSSR